MSSWAPYAIWWHVYPLGFTGAPAEELPAEAEPVHRLGHLINWLDYAIELGCSGILLGPIFASASHGYDTVDYLRIDPRLGDEADFVRLADECRARGLHLLLDGVFNHVGRDFPQFQQALAEGKGSQYDNWFKIYWDNPANEDGAADYECFEGHRALVTLNHDEPAVADYVSTVMNHWQDRGASGWRLDAAYAVPPAFWRGVLPAVRSAHPDTWIVGEMIHGDYSGYVAESGIDSVTQYELWKATWSSINDGNFYELAWALERHEGFAREFLPMTFVGNHDVTRIASKLENPEFVGHALALLFTLAGSPSIYYGDEQGLRGDKEERIGGDDAIRPAYPSSPDELPDRHSPALRMHEELIALRRRHAWLAECVTTASLVANEQLALICTPRDGSLQPADGSPRTIVVLLNLSEFDYRFADVPANGARIECASSQRPPEDDAVAVPPRSWAILCV